MDAAPLTFAGRADFLGRAARQGRRFVSRTGDESTMSVPRPHFLLFSDSKCHSNAPRTRGNQRPASGEGSWRFVLEAIDGNNVLQAEDVESETSQDRLALLAVVRGLEALDQPSRVTLVTSNRYVARGLRFGLREWRENQWRWERFGQMAPIPNGDLWQRIDGALQYHHVECRAVGSEWRDEPILEQRSRPLAARRRPGRGRWRHAARALGERLADLQHWWTSGGRRSASHAAC
jgi:ribonuclease HI